MKIAWSKPKSIVATVEALSTFDDLFESFDPSEPSHRGSLALLSDAVFTKIVKEVDDLHKFIRAGYLYSEDENMDAALRVYDALLLADETKVTDVGASNALFALTKDWKGDAADVARANRYIKRWSHKGQKFIPLCSNLAAVLVCLGKHEEAIANLQRCVLLNDPTLDLEFSGFAPLRKLPAFKALAKLKPTYPAALQTLAMHLNLNIPASAEGAASCDIEWLYAEPMPLSKTGFPSGLSSKADACLSVFGETQDGGLLAFWERKEGVAIEDRPIVILGSDGMFSVYAPHLLGFLTLLSHGCRVHGMENIGVRLGGKKQRLVPEGGLPPSLKRIPKFAAALASRTPAIAKRKAAADRDAAIALIPELGEALSQLQA